MRKELSYASGVGVSSPLSARQLSATALSPRSAREGAAFRAGGGKTTLGGDVYTGGPGGPASSGSGRNGARREVRSSDDPPRRERARLARHESPLASSAHISRVVRSHFRVRIRLSCHSPLPRQGWAVSRRLNDPISSIVRPSILSRTARARAGRRRAQPARAPSTSSTSKATVRLRCASTTRTAAATRSTRARRAAATTRAGRRRGPRAARATEVAFVVLLPAPLLLSLCLSLSLSLSLSISLGRTPVQ